MWELARETQYADNYLKGKKYADELEAPWHFTKMFEKEAKDVRKERVQ